MGRRGADVEPSEVKGKRRVGVGIIDSPAEFLVSLRVCWGEG